MSEIAKLELQVKKAKRRSANKVVIELDSAKALCNEIQALHNTIEELKVQNEQKQHKVTPIEQAVIEVQLRGNKFKD